MLPDAFDCAPECCQTPSRDYAGIRLCEPADIGDARHDALRCACRLFWHCNPGVCNNNESVSNRATSAQADIMRIASAPPSTVLAAMYIHRQQCCPQQPG